MIKAILQKEYRMCNRCIMDTTASDIIFDADGSCNYCAEYLALLQKARKDPAAQEGERDAGKSRSDKNNGRGIL